MPINMTEYKMIYKDKVFNVLQIIVEARMPERKPEETREPQPRPTFLEAVYINEDGSVAIVRDEAWCFQFVRKVEK